VHSHAYLVHRSEALGALLNLELDGRKVARDDAGTKQPLGVT
jgi:hypothetical protein